MIGELIQYSVEITVKNSKKIAKVMFNYGKSCFFICLFVCLFVYLLVYLFLFREFVRENSSSWIS